MGLSVYCWLCETLKENKDLYCLSSVDAVTDSVIVMCEPVIVEPLEVVEAMPQPAIVDTIESVTVSNVSQQASDL